MGAILNAFWTLLVAIFGIMILELLTQILDELKKLNKMVKKAQEEPPRKI